MPSIRLKLETHRKRCASWLAVLLLSKVVVFGFGGCAGKVDAPTADGSVEVFVAVPLKTQIVEWDEYVGRLEPVEFVEVRARVSGYLHAIHFEEGRVVKKGDLLCVIDPMPFIAEVTRMKANLEEGRAKVQEATARLAQAQAEVKQSEARRSLALARFTRTKELVAKDAMTVEEAEIRETEFAQASADVEAAQARMESARAAIITAEAAVATAQANLAIAELDLGYTQVRSPITGRTGHRVVTEGNLVSQTTLLTTVLSLDPIHAVFDADEQSFLKYTRLAQAGTRQSSREVKNPVYLALADERDGFHHLGHMDFVDNRMDKNTGTMRGRAIFPNPDGLLTPGLFVRARLPGSGRYEAILIPDSAIGTDQSEKYVLVALEDGKTRRQVITLGPVAKGLRIVRQGLDGSERIVVRGIQRIRPGTPITAKLEQIQTRRDDGLPDDYRPVPKEEWLSRSPAQPGLQRD